jgi:hypothetical protein
VVETMIRPGRASRRAESRRVRELQALSDDQLFRRILDSDYFDLRATIKLRHEPRVHDFLVQVEARNRDALYRTFFDDNGEVGIPIFLLDAERAIGLEGRPMIGDCYQDFAAVARELHVRAAN